VEEIFVPGEPEARRRRQLMRDGIVVDDPLWQELAAQASDMGIGAVVTEATARSV
jgi:LDH2 family malate/lactate/ureidoglycolate dehydrogenase